MIRLALISVFLLLQCSPQVKSAKVTKNNSEMLFGKINLEQLYFDYPVWDELESKYEPKNDIVTDISNYSEPIEIIVFLGTWCGDSRRNVPKFFKTVKKNTNFEFEIWAVDRRKMLDNDLIKKYTIKRVPTFIFLKDGAEFGRITENPQKSIEEDILEILNSKKE